MEKYDPLGVVCAGQIDSLLKLRLILLFTEHPWLRLNKLAAQQRLGESPWTILEALDELAHAGFLHCGERLGQAEFWLTSAPERRARLERLARAFDDPQRREEIYNLTRAAREERRFRDAGAARLRAIVAGDFDGFVV